MTNLLTRCPVSIFCCFWFHKSYTGNILRIARDKNPGSYFTVTYTESKGESEEGHEAPTPPGGAAPPARQHMVWGPQGSPEAALSPINTSLTENPKYPIRNL